MRQESWTGKLGRISLQLPGRKEIESGVLPRCQLSSRAWSM